VKDQILHLGFFGKVAIQSAPVSYLSEVKSILHFKPTVLMNRHVFCFRSEEDGNCSLILRANNIYLAGVFWDVNESCDVLWV